MDIIKSSDRYDVYFNGETLYGDDFEPSKIAEWYEDEKEGYANLGAKDAAKYKYGYHAWNIYHAWRHLKGQSFASVLGFGSAYGDELLPIISQIQQITIVDPSDAFTQSSVHGVPSKYVKPMQNGQLPLPSGIFDLVSCLGVLHHIPNVSFVVSELARALKPGGYMVVREPIISMGDWRKPRNGLTKRERGIPLNILIDCMKAAGLNVIRHSFCAFPLTPRLFRYIKSGTYNSNIAVIFDSMISSAFAWNVNYHPKNILQRLRPTSAFLILNKPLSCAIQSSRDGG